MNTQFKKGVIEMCVLALASEKDCYGYELIESISKEIEISEGAVYPILRRLTKDGYFETYLKESDSGPPRKYYRITKLGKAEASKVMLDWKEFIKQVNKIIESRKNEKRRVS